MLIYEHQNPQLDHDKMTEVGLSPDFNGLIEQNCTKFKEPLDENILTKQSDGNISTEINKNDANIAFIDTEIKNSCVISTEEKEKTSVIFPSNDTSIG
jgi:hypothetical protein